MGQNFIEADRDQQFLMPPNVREWLPAGHLVWFVVGAVERMDLSGFFARYGGRGAGHPAYAPPMMVALLLYSYCVGERSSRRIERRCVEDVAFRVVCGNLAPDHTTIARFRAQQQEAIEGLFGQVLGLCREAGLLSSLVLAVDSTKIEADASGQRNLRYREIAREVLEEAARIDAEEDELYGADNDGWSLPGELADPERRRAFLDEAKKRWDAENAAEQAKADDRAEREAAAAAEGRKLRGVKPKRRDPSEPPPGQLNLTDIDSQPMRTANGFIQGYNAQTVANENQIIVAADVITTSPDGGQLEPMISAARQELQAAGASDAPGVVVGDAGYWKRDDIETVQADGIRVLVPPDKNTHRHQDPRRQGGFYAQMRADLASPDGADLYKRRQQIIEPIFGDIKHNRKAGRFKRRGLAACRSEWRLICATNNLLKAWRAGMAPQPA